MAGSAVAGYSAALPNRPEDTQLHQDVSVAVDDPREPSLPPPAATVDRLEHEANLSALFHEIDEGFCLAEIVLDAEGYPCDYRFLEVNPQFEAMTGLQDAAGRTALELVPDLERHWIDMYARVGNGREILRFEQGSDALGRWFDVFATPVGPHGRFGLVFKDMTERHAAEVALRDSEARWRGIFDNAAVGVAQVDLEGRWVRVNGKLAEITGYSRRSSSARRSSTSPTRTTSRRTWPSGSGCSPARSTRTRSRSATCARTAGPRG